MTINGWGGQSSPRRRQRLASEIFDYFATPDDDKEDMQEQKEVMLGYASQLALHPQALSAGLVTIANALNLMVPKALRVRIRISEREDDGLGQEWHGQMLRRYHCLPAPGNNLVRDAARRYKFMAGLNAAMLKQGTLDPASSKLARQDQVKYSEFHDTLMSSSNLSDGEEWLFQLASRLLETLCPLAELVGETRARQIVQLGRQLANETGKIQCHIGVDPILRFCGNFSREVASLIEFGRSDVAATIFMATVRFCDVKEVQMRLNALRCVQNSGLDWREMKRVQDTSMNDFKAWSTALSRIIGPAEIDSDLREKLFQAALKLLSRIEPEIWHRAKLTGPRIVRLANGLASLKIKGREKRNHPTFVDELFADPASLENDASSLVSALQQVVEVSRPNSGES